MTIASEITALQTNLAAAKSAVTTKGGTVGDTGLAGLASEIATIPSGGGGEDWGTVTFSSGGQTKTVTIQNEGEYNSLCIYGSSREIGGETFWNSDISEVKLGKSATYAPNNFLRGATNMTTLTGTENLRMIGDNFLYTCQKLDSAMDLSKATNIHDNFMYGCTVFNKAVTISSVTYIGGSFMSECNNFAQTLTVPAGVTSVGANFMYNCKKVTALVVNSPTSNSALTSSNNSLATNDNTAPMYTTGVTVTGSQATRWKNRLGDRSSSPYRKLILGT